MNKEQAKKNIQEVIDWLNEKDEEESKEKPKEDNMFMGI